MTIHEVVRNEIEINRDLYSAIANSPSEQSVKAIADMVFTKITIKHGNLDEKKLKNVVTTEVQEFAKTKHFIKTEVSSYQEDKPCAIIADGYYFITRGCPLPGKMPAIKFIAKTHVVLQLDATSVEHQTLLKLTEQHDGLCELVCNRILISDLLGKDEKTFFSNVTVESINTDEIKKSHLMDVYSKSCLVAALLFGTYPDNIFSYAEQKKLVTKSEQSKYQVNKEILKNGLEKTPDQETLKLEVFNKEFFHLTGHSMLIKKTGKNYIFFDPNFGEYRNVSFIDLCTAINNCLNREHGTNLLFIRGSDFLKRLPRK